jgi:hypothetical protein
VNQPHYSIYRTEVGRSALGKAFTDEKLFQLCEDEGDSKGSLHFLVRLSVPVSTSQNENAADHDAPWKGELDPVREMGQQEIVMDNPHLVVNVQGLPFSTIFPDPVPNTPGASATALGSQGMSVQVPARRFQRTGSRAPGGPRAVRSSPLSSEPQAGRLSDLSYGTNTGPSRDLPLLPASPGPLLPSGNYLNTHASPSLDEEVPPPPYHPHRAVPQPGVSSPTLKGVHSQTSAPSYPNRSLPSITCPIPKSITIPSLSPSVRALPVPVRNNAHDQLMVPLPHRPADSKNPQTSNANTALHLPHKPFRSIMPQESTYLNSAVRPVLDQHSSSKEQVGTQTIQPQTQISLPPAPPRPLPPPYELRRGTGIGTGMGYSTSLNPPLPPLPPHTHLSQGQGVSLYVPPAPASPQGNAPRAPETPDSGESQGDVDTLRTFRPTTKEESTTGTNMSAPVNTWVEPLMLGTRVSRGPRLRITIGERLSSASPQKTSSGGYTTPIPFEVPPMPQGPPPSPPSPPRAGVGSQPRTPALRLLEKAEVPGSSWASRPNPDEVIERLERYFPDYDLDQPAIEASSSVTLPTVVEHLLTAQAPAQDQRKHKKSIRIIARERMSQQPEDSELVSDDSFANNLSRKRSSTKLWNSRIEEVTPGQIKAGMAGAPGSPSSAVMRQREFSDCSCGLSAGVNTERDSHLQVGTW